MLLANSKRDFAAVSGPLGEQDNKVKAPCKAQDADLGNGASTYEASLTFM